MILTKGSAAIDLDDPSTQQSRSTGNQVETANHPHEPTEETKDVPEHKLATVELDVYDPLSTTETQSSETVAPDEHNNTNTPSETHPTTANAATGEPEQPAQTEATDQTRVADDEINTPKAHGETPKEQSTDDPLPSFPEPPQSPEARGPEGSTSERPAPNEESGPSARTESTDPTDSSTGNQVETANHPHEPTEETKDVPEHEPATVEPDVYDPLSTTETQSSETVAPDEDYNASTPSDAQPSTEDAATNKPANDSTGEPEQPAQTETTDQTSVADDEINTPKVHGETPKEQRTTTPEDEPATAPHKETSASETASAVEGPVLAEEPQTEAAASDADTVAAEPGAEDPVVQEQLKTDLQSYRSELGVPDERHTIAVGRTDIPELQAGEPFRGASPIVRREAGLSSLDEAMPNREITTPRKVPSIGRNHAEEGVINEFNDAFKRAGLHPKTEGTLFIHQSNPSGVCGNCLQGFRPGSKVQPGTFLQLSRKYPNLTISVTSAGDAIPGGTRAFTLKGGSLTKG